MKKEEKSKIVELLTYRRRRLENKQEQKRVFKEHGRIVEEQKLLERA